MNSEIVKDRLQFLADQNNGKLTADLVLADAQDPASPLHTEGGFNWNVQEAARLHWLDHARFLIRSVRITVTTQVVRYKSVAYVRDPQVGPNEQGYISVGSLRTDKQLSREALQNEIEAALAHVRRAREISISLDLSEEFDPIYEALTAIQVVVNTPVPPPEQTAVQ